MTIERPRSTKKQESIPNGTHVSFDFGATKRIGTIIEDRGLVSAGTRHLYRIEFSNDEETYFVELPTSDFQVLTETIEESRALAA